MYSIFKIFSVASHHHIIQLFNRGIQPNAFYQDNLLLKKKDGNEDLVLLHITQISNNDYSITLFLIAEFQPILFKKLKELETKNNELVQFSHSVSHDLQEHIRTIMNFTGLLSSKYINRLDINGNRCIHFIQDSAHKLQSMIKDLLSYSRLGRVNQVISNVDLNELIKEVINGLDEKIQQTNAKVKVDKLPTINTISHEIRLLFHELIDNALTFSKEEGLVKIRISASEKEEDWIFSIEDNGIGIDEKYSNRLFNMLYRLTDDKKNVGNGAGLAKAKKIVELNDGKIWYKSNTKGGNTTFCFILNKN